MQFSLCLLAVDCQSHQKMASDDTQHCQHEMLYQKINSSNVPLYVLGPVKNDAGHLSCITKVDLPAHLRYMSKIKRDGEMMDNEEIHYPVNYGEICLAKMPSIGYFRVKCLESHHDGDGFLMVYAIDFGMVCQIEAHTLRVRFHILHSIII